MIIMNYLLCFNQNLIFQSWEFLCSWLASLEALKAWPRPQSLMQCKGSIHTQSYSKSSKKFIAFLFNAHHLLLPVNIFLIFGCRRIEKLKKRSSFQLVFWELSNNVRSTKKNETWTCSHQFVSLMRLAWPKTAQKCLSKLYILFWKTVVLEMKNSKNGKRYTRM